MAIRDDYQTFLKARLELRLQELRAAFSPLLDDPPSAVCQVEIVLFPDDGLTEHPPIMIHLFGRDNVQLSGNSGVARSNALLRSMSPLLSTDEADQFYIWEGEGQDRMVALDQPIDGIDEEALKTWVRDAWRGLNMRAYRCRTVVAVHDQTEVEPLTDG